MMARGQGSGAMVVAGVTPRRASAPTRRHNAGTRMSMAAKREPSTGWTRTASGTSSGTPERTTRCSSSSRSSETHPLSRFSVTTPRLVPRAGTALTTTRTAARYRKRVRSHGEPAPFCTTCSKPEPSQTFTWYDENGPARDQAGCHPRLEAADRNVPACDDAHRGRPGCVERVELRARHHRGALQLGQRVGGL